MQPNVCAIQKVKGGMTQSPPPGTDGGPPQPRKDSPPEIVEIIWPAIQVGGLSGKLLDVIWHLTDHHKAPILPCPLD